MGAPSIRYAHVGEFRQDQIISFEKTKIRGHDAYVGTAETGEQVRFNRVTSIKGILGEEALIGWAAKMAALWFEDNWDHDRVYTLQEKWDLVKQARSHWRKFRDQAGKWGTEAHENIEHLFLHGSFKEGLRPEPVDHSLKLFSQFWDANDYEAMKTEFAVFYAPLAYGGLLDLLCWNNRRQLGVIDYKTSTGIWADYWLQVAAYVKAARAMGYPVEWAAILHISKTDPYPRLQVFTLEQLSRAFKCFKHCAMMYPDWKAIREEQRVENEQWKLYSAELKQRADDEQFSKFLEEFLDESEAA